MPQIRRQKITPFLWFDNQAQEAAKFYVSLFRNSRIMSVSYYGEAGPGPKDSVMLVNFELEGCPFMALNAGPVFQFNESFSLFVNCDSQQEVDELWEKLTVGGQEGRCGWLKDRYGLSWQIIPSALMDALADPTKSKRAMNAMLQMNKIDIERIKTA